MYGWSQQLHVFLCGRIHWLQLFNRYIFENIFCSSTKKNIKCSSGLSKLNSIPYYPLPFSRYRWLFSKPLSKWWNMYGWSQQLHVLLCSRIRWLQLFNRYFCRPTWTFCFQSIREVSETRHLNSQAISPWTHCYMNYICILCRYQILTTVRQTPVKMVEHVRMKSTTTHVLV